MNNEICPKCSSQLSAPAESCPRCGVIFARMAAVESQRNMPRQPVSRGPVLDMLLYVKEGENSLILGFKIAFLAVLVLYGFKLIFTPILAFPHGNWWMHAVNLVFHEAGHVFFSPFGRFIHVLGGTLGQLLIPAIVLGSFLWKRDIFGAVVGTWWFGESLLDIAPYANDARAGELMLLGGVTGSEVEDYHDWEVMLTKLGMMQYDHAIAKTFFTIGSLIMIAAMLWGAWILWQEWQLRERA